MFKNILYAAILAALLVPSNALAQKHGHDVYVAASDSYKSDKKQADLVCSGKDDQAVIQQAIDRLGRGGTVHLASGNYFITAFSKADSGPDYAIKTNADSKVILQGAIRANSSVDLENPPVNGTRLIMTSGCYQALSADKEYSVLRGDVNSTFEGVMSQELTVSQLSIILPDNQKQIICIDGYSLGALNVDGCRVGTNYFNRGMSPDQEFHIGVKGCIGIRGLQGSNNGSETIFKSTYAIGLGTGFALSGEHLVCIQLGAIGNLYGYTFNGFKHEVGVWCHPITLINCCDEVSANYPFFGQNSYGQSVNFINFNMEHYPNMFSHGGDYAREEEPGQWHGNIDYDIQDWENCLNGGESSLRNSPYRRFWQGDGSGSGFTSKNNTQGPSCDSDGLSSFAPNPGQIIFCTTTSTPMYCLHAGDYAKVRLVFRSGSKSNGVIKLKVGYTQRSLKLDKTFGTAEEFAEYLWKQMSVDTSCWLKENSSIDICSSGIGKIEDSDISFDPGETGIKADVEVVSYGEDNSWLPLTAPQSFSSSPE